jgi:hypothetical protein
MSIRAPSTVIFLVFDGVIKLMRLPMVLDASARLGFPRATASSSSS